MLASSDYIELLKSFPPRPIDSDEKFVATQKVINSLLDRKKLSEAERDYLNVLGTLVYEYEQKQEPIPDIYGIELLESLLQEFGLKQEDLVPLVFETNSIVSEVLRGKRELTAKQIENLASFFHISPACFFPNKDY
ncbi:MAG: transcriptional regulator [Cyanobacteriota bacterium]|nr:transcriptional regulator [Cyanobacteriota bacterium]